MLNITTNTVELSHLAYTGYKENNWIKFNERLEEVIWGASSGLSASIITRSFLHLLGIIGILSISPVISASLIAVVGGAASLYFSKKDNIDEIKEKFNEFANSLLRYFNEDEVFAYDSEKNIITNLSKTIQYNVSENTLLVNKDLALADELPNSVRLMDKAIKVIGNSQDNYLYGNAHNNILEGKNSNDHLFGNLGDDRLFGQEGNDYINGGIGNDFLYSEAGNDILEGAKGNDKLEAGEGNDQLFGGLGNDMLYGATGNDTYHFSSNFGEDVIIDNNSNDRIIFDNNIDIRKMLLSLEQGDLKISFIDKNDNITVKGWKNRSFQIETIEARDGMKLNNHQLDHLINEMAVFFSQSTSIDAQSVTESKLIELYSNFGIVQIP